MNLLQGHLGVFGSGIKIIENAHLIVRIQFRFSKRKKKRIIKKFERNTKNFRFEPDMRVYMAGDLIICHPALARKFKEEVSNPRTFLCSLW